MQMFVYKGVRYIVAPFFYDTFTAMCKSVEEKTLYSGWLHLIPIIRLANQKPTALPFQVGYNSLNNSVLYPAWF